MVSFIPEVRNNLITDRVKAVLAHEGSATFVTTGEQGPHLAATWQSYIQIVDASTIAFPAGGMRQTEANVQAGSSAEMLIGSHLPEENGKGVGFRLVGSLEFQSGTPLHEQLKQRFPWCRAAVVMHIVRVDKVLG